MPTLSTALLLTAFALAEEHWSGAVDTGPEKLGIVVTFTDDGAMLSIPAQGLDDGPLRDVLVDDAHAEFTLGLPSMPEAAWAHFALDLDRAQGTAQGTMVQRGQTFPVTLTRLAGGEPKPPGRPQEPKPPFPYAAREVVVTHDEVRLAGTLTLPEGPGPHTAIVLLTGSGAQDRDEQILGHRPFWVIADHLSRRGVAVLRLDDRGIGGSTSPHPATDTTLDYVDDALAAVAYLRGLPEIGEVGLVGHSEGGLVASIAASRSKDVAFIGLLAGPGVPGRDLLVAQAGGLSAALGASPEDVARAQAAQGAVLDQLLAGASDDALLALVLEANGQSGPEAEAAVRASITHLRSPWMTTFLTLDPADALRRVRCPVLALNGSLDRQVPASQNLPAITAALHRNRRVSIVELPGLNHLFQTATTGAPREYAQIEETFAPAALEALTAWLQAL